MHYALLVCPSGPATSRVWPGRTNNTQTYIQAYPADANKFTGEHRNITLVIQVDNGWTFIRPVMHILAPGESAPQNDAASDARKTAWSAMPPTSRRQGC
jgi:hypothetical protein